MTGYSKYREIYIARGIWEKWHPMKWNDYVYPFYREKIQELVSSRSTQNVLLYGQNGMGKSMLMNLAMKAFLHKEYSVYVIDFRNLIKEYTKTWGKDGNSQLPALLDCDYLAIDDIGKEFSAGGVSKELATTALDYVLRHRFQRQLPTWITFNMPLGEISTVYNEHIASLLKRSSIAIFFEGTDYGDTVFEVVRPPEHNTPDKVKPKGTF